MRRGRPAGHPTKAEVGSNSQPAGAAATEPSGSSAGFGAAVAVGPGEPGDGAQDQDSGSDSDESVSGDAVMAFIQHHREGAPTLGGGEGEGGPRCPRSDWLTHRNTRAWQPAKTPRAVTG